MSDNISLSTSHISLNFTRSYKALIRSLLFSRYLLSFLCRYSANWILDPCSVVEWYHFLKETISLNTYSPSLFHDLKSLHQVCMPWYLLSFRATPTIQLPPKFTSKGLLILLAMFPSLNTFKFPPDEVTDTNLSKHLRDVYSFFLSSSSSL